MTEKTEQERIAEVEKGFPYPVQITKDPATGEYVTRCIGQQTAQLTPGKWWVEERHHVNAIMDEKGPLTYMDKTPKFFHEEPCGNLTSRDRTAEELHANARLIVAAVNACRKAGYGVDRLEAGCLKRDIETGERLRESEAHFHAAWCHEEEGHLTAKAALAECREALRLLHDETSYITPTPAPLVEARIHARAILARLDAQE